MRTVDKFMDAKNTTLKEKIMKEIVTKITPVDNDTMKTNEIIDAMNKISYDTETLIERGISPSEIDGVLSKLGTELTVKVSGAINIMKKYEGLALAASARAKEIGEIAKSYNNKVEQLREYLKYAMGASGTKKIEAEHYTITYSRVENSSVEVFDETQIPREYQRVKVEPDKIAIKATLKKGENVPGCKLVDSERIIIKG